MPSIEEQIERVADAAVAASPPRPVSRMDHRLRKRHVRTPRLLVAAAAVVLVAGLVAALAFGPLRSDDGGDVAAPSPDPVTVQYDADGRWLTSPALPAGIVFDLAVRPGPLPDQALHYRSSDSSREVQIRTGAPGSVRSTPGESHTIGSVEWILTTIPIEPREDPAADRFRALTRGDFPAADGAGTAFVEVSGTVSFDELVAIAESLDWVAEPTLPRPPLSLPLDRTEAVPAGRTNANGRTVRLLAASDGVHYVLEADRGAGGPIRLPPDGYIAVGGAQGPLPGSVGGGREAESTLTGLLHPEVASVDLELTDGRVISTEPQDEYGFPENFFYVAFPTTTEFGLELLGDVVARDANGEELQRVIDPY